MTIITRITNAALGALVAQILAAHCPACNSDCRQGRTCRNRKDRTDGE